jgi:cytochrome c-type protein NapB
MSAQRLLLAAACLALAVSAHLAAAADPAPVKLEGLRGGLPVDQDVPAATFKQERDHAPAERDFVQQPPLIPHTIAGYQITLNYNKCMDCHAWNKAKETGATKVSLSHFRDREGQELDNVAPRRYFCNQCHVPQTEARPLVGNTFRRARGLQ